MSPNIRSATVPIENVSKNSGPRRGNLWNQHILIVDDSRDYRELVSCLLQAAGAIVFEVADGPDAVVQASQGSYNLILLDIQLPNLSGHEVAKELRKLGFSGKILALTANQISEDASEWSAFDGLIPKSVPPHLIVSEIQALIDKSTSAPNTSMPKTADDRHGNTDPDFRELATLSPQVRSIIARFIERLPERIQDLEQACHDRATDTLIRLAHQLKGTAASCGLMRLMHQAAIIEDLAIAGHSYEILTLEIRKLKSLQVRAKLGLDQLIQT